MEPDEYARMDAAENSMWWYRALHTRLILALHGVEGPVLDAGCGTGGFLARLAACQNLKPTGVEFSPIAARRAAEKSGLPVAAASVHALPFASAQFAAVIVADVLCHEAVQPQVALAEIHRVLSPGGRIIVNMPAYGWLLSAHDRRVHNTRRQTVTQLRLLLESAGFARPALRYWNSLLLPIMIIQRKLLARRAHASSDVATFPPWLDATFGAITELERQCGLPTPAGGSIIGTAERP